jgi:EcsC protein family
MGETIHGGLAARPGGRPVPRADVHGGMGMERTGAPMSAGRDAALSHEDREVLRDAKRMLEDPGFAAKIANLLGAPIEGVIEKLPRRWSALVTKAVERSLAVALDTALLTVADHRTRPSRDRLHKLMVAGTGAAGGAFGLVALPVELPASTLVMLRSIADIARSEGDDLNSVGAKLACIEVFALGGRTSSDDANESAYFAARAALATAVSDAARYLAARSVSQKGAPVLLRLMAQIASRFGVVVTQKVTAQAVPVIGAAGGATVNLLFMAHFQNIARGHFMVRRLERKYGPDLVRSEYERLVV